MKKDNRKYLILSIICILSLVPFVVASFFSRPSADDFDYSYPLFHMIQNGNTNMFSLLGASIDMMKYYYQNWQGTYSSAIFMSLQTGIWGDKYYFIGTFFLIALMYVCLYRFFYILNKRVLRNTIPTYFLSLLLLTLFLNTCPYISQCLFWQCGAYHYIPFFFFDLIVISFDIEYLCSKEKKDRIFNIAFASVLSFIISGGNQVTSFLNMLILCLFILYSIYKKKNVGLIVPLIVGIIGFLIMFFAPGNSVRLDNTVQTSILIAIVNSFKGTLKYLYRWLNINWIALLLMMVTLLLPLVNNFNYKLSIHPTFVFVVTYLLFAAMFCPTNYAMSTNGPGRLKNIIYFALVIFSVIDIIYLLLWLKQKYDCKLMSVEGAKKSIVLLILILIVCFYPKGNNITAVRELNDGTIKNFAKAHDDRVQLILSSKEEIVKVKPLPECKTLKFDDITVDINDCRNIWWAEYYGVKTVIE